MNGDINAPREGIAVSKSLRAIARSQRHLPYTLPLLLVVIKSPGMCSKYAMPVTIYNLAKSVQNARTLKQQKGRH